MSEYVIITPIKNEKGNIEKTIISVVNQIQLPLEWIIIDDNSNDGSENIIKEAAKEFDWIKIFYPEKYELKDYSSRVVHLVNFGFSKISKKVDFISKLDADVSFDKFFYKNIIEKFNSNSKLGIASGHLMENKIPEINRKTTFICTRGATKVYRVKCLEDIGGIICYQGWDTLDNVAARSKGWQVAILPEYFEHLKKEGSKVGNLFYSNYRTGFYNGSIPYYLPYFFVKILYTLIKKPIFFGSILQIVGYTKGRLFNQKRPFPKYIVRRLHFEQKQYLLSIIDK